MGAHEVSGGVLRNSDVRENNLGLVLSHLERAGSASRSEIATGTGLVRGSITTLIGELIDAGLVRAIPGDRPPAPARGRPLELLEIDGTRYAIVAVQFLLDRILVSAQDLAGRPIADEVYERRTPLGDPGALAELVAECLNLALGDLRDAAAIPVALQLVVPGPVRQGAVFSAIDFGWGRVDLAELIRPRLPAFPFGIAIANDADMAAYAEFVALREEPDFADVENIVYLKSDTGIGGGAIIEGRLFEGPLGTAFEPGHLIVVPDGELCECGNRGCLVTVAGPDVVLRDAGLAGALRRDGAPAALAELLDRAAAGEPRASSAIARAEGWIRIALVNLIVLFSPQAIVVGGYLADVVDGLRQLDGMVLGMLGTPEAPGRAAIRAASQGPFAALHGALAIRRHLVLRDPLRLVRSGDAASGRPAEPE